MNGYMDLFLETGSPAFYMMAKRNRAAAGGAAYGTAGGAAAHSGPGGEVVRPEDPTTEEGTSPR